MKYLPIIILFLLVNFSACDDNDDSCVFLKKPAKSCIIDKIVYWDAGFEIDFKYDDKNRLISLFRNDRAIGFLIEYNDEDELKEVKQLTDDGYNRLYKYKNFPTHTEILVTDPSTDFSDFNNIILRKNLCGQIIQQEFYQDKFNVFVGENKYYWVDGNLVRYRPTDNYSNCSTRSYDYDNKKNPFGFLSEILINPFLGSRNNITYYDGGDCFSDYDIEIDYLNNGYPRMIRGLNLSVIFGLALKGNIIYQDCP